MKTVCTSLIAAFLAANIVTPSANAGDCDVLGPCVSIGNIAVMAEDAIADPILSTAQDGAVSFKRYFGAENAPIAIVPGGEITPDLQRDLKAAGYALSLPWISAADKAALRETRIRQQVLEQTKNMTAEQQESILKMALAKAGSASSPQGEMNDTEQGALTHELGHMWFIAAFQPADEEVKGGHGYGGWAPDWLDEIAAILLENETLTEKRREAFRTMAAEDMYPLETFLTMDHPALKSALALSEKIGLNKDVGGQEKRTGSRAIVLSGKDAEAFLKASGDSNPANFYTQARGFADYVMAETGDEQIFMKLAIHLSRGDTFENWLTEIETLPDRLQELDEDWRDWLSAR